MARCLLGAFVVTAGLVALASVARGTRSSVPVATPTTDTPLRGQQSLTPIGTPRTLLRPAPVFGLAFSLN